MAASNSALKIGTVLNGSGIKYKIIDVLGQGGFGITYLAVGEVIVNNIPGEMKFAIKEHFPSSSCKRIGHSVVVDDDKLNGFKSSLGDFISEAKKLHSLGNQNENIVKVNEVFEENGTAYYVMQYINGESLASYVKAKGKLSYHEAIGLLSPIFDAIDFLHKSRINHLDIKPENIMLHRGVDGIIPILIDFGLSVHFKKSGGITSPKGIEGVSEGYSPLEQYAGIKEFNPATDIYALAATLLYTITGKTPKSASEIRLSETRSTIASIVPHNAIDGICKALRQSYEDRTSSIKDLKSELGLTSGGSSITVVLDKDKEKKKKYLRALLIGFALIVLLVIVVILFTRKPSNPYPAPEPTPIDTTCTDSVSPGEVVPTFPSKEFIQSIENTYTLAKEASICIKNGQKRGHFTVAEGNQLKNFIDIANLIQKSSELSLLNQRQKKTYEVIIKESSNAQDAIRNYKIYDAPEKTPSPKSDPGVSPTPQKTEVREGTLQLGYGSWKGGIKNGKPDGKGRITFTSSHRVDRSSSVEANPGDYFIATYDNGSLISGKLYDSAGNLLQTIIP